MGSVWKRLQRGGGGKQAAKVRVEATLEQLLVEGGDSWQPETLTVVWTRGHRRVCSQPRRWQPGIQKASRGMVLWVVPESLQVTVTLYRDPEATSYDGKEWTFLILNESRGRRSVLAAAPLDLGRVASAGGAGGGEGTLLALPLRPATPKVLAATLRMRLRARPLRRDSPTEEELQRSLLWSPPADPPAGPPASPLQHFRPGRDPPAEADPAPPGPGGHQDPPPEISPAFDDFSTLGGCCETPPQEPPPVGTTPVGTPPHLAPPPGPQASDTEEEEEEEEEELGPPQEPGTPQAETPPDLGPVEEGSQGPRQDPQLEPPQHSDLDDIEGGSQEPPQDPQMGTSPQSSPLDSDLDDIEGGSQGPPQAPQLEPPPDSDFDDIEGGSREPPQDPQLEPPLDSDLDDIEEGSQGPPQAPQLGTSPQSPPPDSDLDDIEEGSQGPPQAPQLETPPQSPPPDSDLDDIEGGSQGPPQAPQLESPPLQPPLDSDLGNTEEGSQEPPLAPPQVTVEGAPPRTPPLAGGGHGAAAGGEGQPRGALVPPPRQHRPGGVAPAEGPPRGPPPGPTAPPRTKSLARGLGDPPPREPLSPPEGEMELVALQQEQQQLEAQAAAMGRELQRCMAAAGAPPPEAELLQAWLLLVNLRSSLLWRQEELRLLAQEQDLQRRCQLLSQELRHLLDAEGGGRPRCPRQGQLLAELVALVEQRDRVLRDIDRGQAQAEAEAAMVQRGLEQYRSPPRGSCCLL